MKKMRYKNYLACLVFLGLFAGCKEEFIERPPQDQLVDANYYQTGEQVLLGTAPLYNVVWFAYNDKASYGIGDGRGGTYYSTAQDVEHVRMSATGTQGSVGSSWRSFYNIIAQANTVITNINKYTPASVSIDIKNHGLGEARFMRGLAYSYLVQNWGPVPIITDNTSLLTDTTITRNTIESVWEFVIRDLRFAAQVLPPTPVQKGRLTKYAAQGMLARMYLTRAGVGKTQGNRSQNDLDSAKYYAQSVILNSGAKLVSNYEDLFKIVNNNNTETLFALQWVYNGTWGSNNSLQAYIAFGSEITGFSDGWGGGIGATADILKTYEDLAKDKRRKATYMFPGDRYDYISQRKDVNGDGTTRADETGPLVVLTDNNGNGATKGIANMKKYVVGWPKDNLIGGEGRVLQQRTEINTYMLRLAEVYLTYAEATLGNAASTTDALALQYYNAVRARAGLVEPKTEVTWMDIFKERRIEFAMEGISWYDFVRLHYYNPQEAYRLLSTQDRGAYRITPVPKNNPTSWTIEYTTPTFYPVNENNFRIPYPEVELSKAPNLLKAPVPYKFD